MPLQALTAQDDLELVQRLERGEDRAFEALMRRHNQMLFRVARSILKNDAEAEDALQDAYIDAYRRIGQFRAEAKLSTWLTRIVINEALARLRRQKRHGMVVEFESLRDEELDNEDVAACTADGPEPAAMRAEARHLIERKLDELPAAFRTVFILREVEELTVEETATCLSVPEATVRSRLFRARALLRESLARELDMAATDVFTFAGARCDRIVAAVMERLRTLEQRPSGRPG